MSIQNKCIDCEIIIVDEWFFSCSGYLCNSVIGYNCAAANATKLLKKFPSDLRKGMKLVMDDVPGLRWFCKNCENGVNNILSKIDQSLNKIGKPDETKIDNILKRMEKLEQTLTTVVNALSHSSVQSEERRVTRSMCKASIQTETPSIINTNHTIPSLTSPSVSHQRQIIDHEKPERSNIISETLKKPMQSNYAVPKVNATTKVVEVIDEHSIRVARPRKWLFVSRIHNSVTDEQFRKLLTKIVNTDDLFAQRMVPKPSFGLKYDYVSYKINIPGEVFESTINSSLWPAGLFVKEFDWGQKKAFFQSPHSRQLIP